MAVRVRQPRWQVGQLATFELRDLRSELEHAIERTPEQSADREVLQARLDEVLTEQDTRKAAEHGDKHAPDPQPSPPATAGPAGPHAAGPAATAQ